MSHTGILGFLIRLDWLGPIAPGIHQLLLHKVWDYKRSLPAWLLETWVLGITLRSLFLRGTLPRVFPALPLHLICWVIHGIAGLLLIQDHTCDLMLTVTNFTNLFQDFLNWLIFKKFTERNSFLLLDNTISACDTHRLQQSWNNRDEVFGWHTERRWRFISWSCWLRVSLGSDLFLCSKVNILWFL